MSIASQFRTILTIISPTLNTIVCYKVKFGKILNTKNPKTLTEKILTLKLKDYNSNPLIKRCADKSTVRGYVKERGLEEILIPLIAEYDNVDDINWDELPNEFAMKWNFGCGGNIICGDKKELNIEESIANMKRWGQRKPHLWYAEMQYDIKNKRIVIEECLPLNDGKLPNDYKFFCLNGKCQFIMLCTNRVIGGHADYCYYDCDWNTLVAPESGEQFEKPSKLEDAIIIAEKLAVDFPFVRVDLFIENSKVYFSELTFTPAAGMDIDFLQKPIGQERTIDEIYGELLSIDK